MFMIDNFNRILIIGNGGSGKSTLAKKLRDILSYPLLHLDKIYWNNSWDKNDLAHFDEKIGAFMQQEQWIIEGTPMRGIELSLPKADTVIFLDIHRTICIYRVFKRGTSRIFFSKNDDGCPFNIFSFKGLNWIWNYKKNKNQKILELLAKTKNSTIIKVGNNSDIKQLIVSILRKKSLVH